jgi:hypothetical protein
VSNEWRSWALSRYERRRRINDGVTENVLQIVLEADVNGLIVAGRHERSGDRSNGRIGYPNGRRSASLASIHVRAAARWHLGQCRLQRE